MLSAPLAVRPTLKLTASLPTIQTRWPLSWRTKASPALASSVVSAAAAAAEVMRTMMAEMRRRAEEASDADQPRRVDGILRVRPRGCR